jgi:hypothetical protein
MPALQLEKNLSENHQLKHRSCPIWPGPVILLMKLLYEQQHPVSTHWPALMEDYGNVAWSTTVASKSTAFVSERR